MAGLETSLGLFTALTTPPSPVSEAILDPDNALPIARKFADSLRDHWVNVAKWAKRMELTVVEPIRMFLTTHLKALKVGRRVGGDFFCVCIACSTLVQDIELTISLNPVYIYFLALRTLEGCLKHRSGHTTCP